MSGHTTLPAEAATADATPAASPDASPAATIDAPLATPGTTADATAISLDPVARTSLTESVAVRIEEWIVESRLTVSQRLPSERELARRFEVSRIVVREALGRLAARGLVEVRPGVGTFVAPVEASSVTQPLGLYLSRRAVGLDHLLDVRLALEPAMAAAAARRANEEAIAAMFATVDLTDGIIRDLALEPDALESYAWADLEFHQLLAQASGNPLYDVLLAPLIDRLLEVRRSGAILPGAALKANRGHRAVLEHVAASRPEAAAAAMREHLLYVRGLMDAAAERAATSLEDQTQTPTK